MPINLGYKMMVESDGVTVQFTNLFNGTKWSLSKEQFWRWTNMIHEIASAISNEYNALAVKHQLAIKCKTNDNDNDTTGKDDSTTKIVKEEEEVAAAKKILKEEKGVHATKFSGEQSDGSEDQKAISVQTTFVNHLFIDCFNDHDYDSTSDTSLLDAKTKRICELHVPGLDIPWFFDEQVVKGEKLFIIICAELVIQDIFNGCIFDCYCPKEVGSIEDHHCPARQSIYNIAITPTVNRLYEKMGVIIDCFEYVIGEVQGYYCLHAFKQMIDIFRCITLTSSGRKILKDTVAFFIDEGYHYDFHDAVVIKTLHEFINHKL